MGRSLERRDLRPDDVEFLETVDDLTRDMDSVTKTLARGMAWRMTSDKYYHASERLGWMRLN